MAKVIGISEAGGEPGNRLWPTDRFVRLDCGHERITSTDVPIGSLWPCSVRGCGGNPDTRCTCGIMGETADNAEHTTACPKRYPS